MSRFDDCDELLAYFTPEKLLKEVLHAMSDAEFRDIADHIKRMHGLGDYE